MMRQKNKLFILLVSLVLVVVSFLVGYFVKKTHYEDCGVSKKFVSNAELEEFFDDVVKGVDVSNIQDNLRFFASKPHQAALTQNNFLGEVIFSRFESYGFDVERNEYNVLLSYPQPGKINSVSLIDNNGTVVYKTKGIPINLGSSKKLASPFFAYSPNGSIEGEILYVNYGRKEDYEKLNEMGVPNCTGKILIARSSKLWVGAQVPLAEKCGALGLLVYSDPAGTGEGEELYPNSWYIPHDSVFHSTTRMTTGDILTKGYPAKDWVYRSSIEEAKLPKIPVQPISGLDALTIFNMMHGSEAPKEWFGKFNITYPVTSNKTLKVEVYNERSIKKITNIIGTIRGRVEPDRYVMIGNHRDAWLYGAVDPGSGTTIMMEVARVLGEKLKSGWLPRRTIRFYSWDGEESGLLGSLEHIEEFLHELQTRGIVYMNADTVVTSNQTMRAGGSFQWKELIFNAMKKVPHPLGNETLYERAVTIIPNKDVEGEPLYKGVGGGSDYKGFFQIAGVSVINLPFRKMGIFYPAYHTVYDSVEYVERFVDPGYKAHLATARLTMHCLLRVAELPMLPVNVTSVGQIFSISYNYVMKQVKKRLVDVGVNETEHLSLAIKHFQNVSEKFDQMMLKHSYDPMMTRMLNDVGMLLEKSFLALNTLPDNEVARNYISTLPVNNAEGSFVFPTITDALSKFQLNTTFQEVEVEDFDALRREFTITTTIVESAANSIGHAVDLLSRL